MSASVLHDAPRRRLPAYAADLAGARKRGFTLRKPVVSVSLHWRQRPCVGYGVCVPDDTLPSALDWTWTRGMEVIVLCDGDAAERLNDAIQAIKACKPRRLVVVDYVDHVDATIVSFVVPDRAPHG